MRPTLSAGRDAAIGADPQSPDRPLSDSPDTSPARAAENGDMHTTAGSATRATGRPIRAWCFLVLAALVVPVQVAVLRGLTPRWHAIWTIDPLARVIIVANIVSCGLAAAGGAWMIIRRPSNRCGPAAVLLGAVFAT